MDATHRRPNSSSIEREIASRLADAVSAGEPLPALPSPVPLESGEVLHASAGAHAWRYLALDVTFEQHQGFAVGGLFTFGVTAAAGRQRASSLHDG